MVGVGMLRMDAYPVTRTEPTTMVRERDEVCMRDVVEREEVSAKV
jgi:hypothetical protein